MNMIQYVPNRPAHRVVTMMCTMRSRNETCPKVLDALLIEGTLLMPLARDKQELDMNWCLRPENINKIIILGITILHNPLTTKTLTTFCSSI
jgi:hypothetical protein